MFKKTPEWFLMFFLSGAKVGQIKGFWNFGIGKFCNCMEISKFPNSKIPKFA